MQIRKIIKYFLIWRFLLFVILIFAIPVVPLQKDFLGGGMDNYLKNPYLWSWLNFDGNHYLSIAMYGYKPLQYFYFPLFPLSLGVVAKLLGGAQSMYALSGLLVSNITFFVALLGLTRLVKLDYPDKIVQFLLLLLLLFPTSFYFGSFYTESLFLALIIWSFYFARKGSWIIAGILGALSTAARITGAALFPALIVEAFIQSKENKKHLFLPIASSFAVMLGVITYAMLLDRGLGDPLAFFRSLDQVFGEQRSKVLIFLPQVFYRYLVRILPNINYSYFPAVFTAWFEFLSALIFAFLGGLGILGWGSGFADKLKRFKKYQIRGSYLVFFLGGYLIPTLSGSFSSFPRYVLILFPAFLMSSKILTEKPPFFKWLSISVLFILLIISEALYIRGYWLS